MGIVVGLLMILGAFVLFGIMAVLLAPVLVIIGIAAVLAVCIVLYFGRDKKESP